MSSQIEAIYAALADKTVTVDGKTPPVYGLDNPIGTLTSAKLPVRILHPFGNGSEGRNFAFDGMACIAQMTWTIVDFMAFQAVGQGKPPTGAMIRYQAAYMDMLLTFKRAGGDTNPAIKAKLADARCQAGVYEWPLGSEEWWYGVQAVLNIEEVLV